jgi:hypothetical protein
MAQINRRHGRRRQGAEYYTYQVVMPTVVVQQYGECWVLSVAHVDKTWQVLGYFDELTQAQYVAHKLIMRYSTAVSPTVRDDVQLAHRLTAEYAATRGRQAPAHHV